MWRRRMQIRCSSPLTRWLLLSRTVRDEVRRAHNRRGGAVHRQPVQQRLVLRDVQRRRRRQGHDGRSCGWVDGSHTSVVEPARDVSQRGVEARHERSGGCVALAHCLATTHDVLLVLVDGGGRVCTVRRRPVCAAHSATHTQRVRRRAKEQRPRSCPRTRPQSQRRQRMRADATTTTRR